jgi:peptidoglycan/LPS O-acetylase OafA/YrhL
LYALDVSRGLAALAVAVWHWQHFAYQGTLEPAHFDRSVQPFYGWLRLCYEQGYRGVDYFFLLSGFIFFWIYRDTIADRLISFRDFWILRLSRLYPLHIVTLLAVAFLQWLYVSRNAFFFIYPDNDPYHFLLQLGFASQWDLQNSLSFNGPTWSVSIEILLYLVFFCLACSRRAGAGWCLAIALASAAAEALFPHPIIRGAAMFFLGGFVYAATRWISSKSRRWTNLVCLAAAASWTCLLVDGYLFAFGSLVAGSGPIGALLVRIFPYFILFPFTVCSLALIEIRKGPFLRKISWIGDITYSSYLLHFPLQLIFALAVSYGVLTASFYLSPFALLLFFALLAALSYLTYRKFERPFQQFLRGKLISRPRTRSG